MPAIDVAALRAETPGCQSNLHFNSAGAALMPQPVIDAQISYLRDEGRLGGYEAANLHLARLEDTYAALAELVGGRPDEIALAENATRAWDMVFYGLPLRTGDRILTSRVDYDSNFVAYLQRTKQTGATVEVIPALPTGEVDIEALDAMIDERVRLISISHAPTSNGLINPAEEIGQIARARGIPYLLDACQTIGQLPVNVGRIGCSFLTAAGRKFLRGPRGTGFLWIRRDLIPQTEPAFVDFHSAAWVADSRYQLRSDARRFEAWEANLAARFGLGVAARYMMNVGIEDSFAYIAPLAERMRRTLAEVPGVTVTDQGVQRSAIVTFSVAGFTPEIVKVRLGETGVAITTATCQSSRLSMVPRGLIQGVVRASLHHYNTVDEVEAFVSLVKTLFR